MQNNTQVNKIKKSNFRFLITFWDRFITGVVLITQK
jgi:hypothetical protein